jgi:nucleotide-binding universal stress UspA family protein
MATARIYLVPVDFSKASERALDHAVKLGKENNAKLLLLHVIPNSAMMMGGHEAGTAQMLLEYEKAMQEDADKNMKSLVKRKKLSPGAHRAVILKRGDPAQRIAEQAKKSRVAMIIMGSHGRTGLKRLVLGSVAERTLRYASCPVLIVKG